MKREPFILTARHLVAMRRAAIIGFIVAGTGIAVCSVRLLQAKLHLSDLTTRLNLQRKTLSQLRQTTTPPTSTPKTDQDTVAQVQLTIDRAARANHCKMVEFQASTDRTPYLSSFTLDTNHPDWEQVQIHVTLNGKLGQTLGTIDALRESGLAIEPDSIEITRSEFDKAGNAKVDLHIIFRALVQKGGAA